MRIKEQETRLTLQEHDDDHDDYHDDDDDKILRKAIKYVFQKVQYADGPVYRQ